MALASSLAALCDMLHTRTGASTIVGRPNSKVPGIYVWPWMLEESALTRTVPARINPDGTRTPQAASESVHFLVLVSPALTPDALSKLDAARQAMYDHPILDVAGKKAQIAFNPLAQNELTALFTAASLPLTICLSGTLREIP